MIRFTRKILRSAQMRTLSGGPLCTLKKVFKSKFYVEYDKQTETFPIRHRNKKIAFFVYVILLPTPEMPVYLS